MRGCGPLPRTKSLLNRLQLPGLTLLCVLLLAGCHILSAQRTLRQAQQELARAEQMDLDEESLYHRAMARELIEAAEKQYEDADFSETSRFAQEALQHLSRVPGRTPGAPAPSLPDGTNEATP